MKDRSHSPLWTLVPKPKRGPKPNPETDRKYRQVLKLWKAQLTLDECCGIIGLPPGTFRYKHYRNQNNKNKDTQ